MLIYTPREPGSLSWHERDNNAGQHREQVKCPSAGRYKQLAGMQRFSALRVRGAKVTGCASWSLPAPSMHFMIADADLVVVLSYYPKTAVRAFLRTLLSQILQTPPCFILCVCVCRKRLSRRRTPSPVTGLSQATPAPRYCRCYLPLCRLVSPREGVTG